MPGPVFLGGDEVTLHPVEEEDLPFLQRHRNDPAIRTGLTTTAPQNGYEAQQAHERHTGDDSGVGLLIVPGDDATPDADPVGMVVLFDVDESNGTGELAAWVTPDEQGNGYATAGTRLVLRHAFGERRLHKVVARALVSNAPSRATLEKLGMTEEGVQRDEKYVDGEHHDVVRYSMLRREWGGA